MRVFFRFLTYIKPYGGAAILNILFNILYVLFNLFSISLIIPILELLFKDGKKYTEYLNNPPEGVSFSIDSLKAHFNYFFAEIIQESGKVEALGWLCIIIVTLFFFKNLFLYLGKYFLSTVRSGVVRDLRKILFEKILNLPLSYYSGKRKGDMISRSTSDVQEIEFTMIGALMSLFRDPIQVIVFSF
ncbi:MAG: ABC transporter transmembrane domain-containing protein, partial [Flavobacteriales bacterium]